MIPYKKHVKNSEVKLLINYHELTDHYRRITFRQKKLLKPVSNIFKSSFLFD